MPEEYRRTQPEQVEKALAALRTPVPDAFREFYLRWVGPFVSQTRPDKLLDLVAAAPTVLHSTLTCRREYGWPEKYLVLTEVLDGRVLVLDAEAGPVFQVDFTEGDDLKLTEGTLTPAWDSFEAFLEEFFPVPASA